MTLADLTPTELTIIAVLGLVLVLRNWWDLVRCQLDAGRGHAVAGVPEKPARRTAPRPRVNRSHAVRKAVRKVARRRIRSIPTRHHAVVGSHTRHA